MLLKPNFQSYPATETCNLYPSSSPSRALAHSREMLHSVLLLLVAAGAAAKEIVVTFPDRGPGYPMAIKKSALLLKSFLYL